MAPEVETHLVNAVLTNGARYYVDHAHPELSTPECADPLGRGRYDRAAELILQRSMAAAVPLLPEGQEIVVYKNNSDGKGNSYGCHENYLMDRQVPFGRIVAHVMPHFITRQIFTGAGKVGTEVVGMTSDEVPFQLTQRADFFEEEVGLETTLKRPIVNTRDEPHADAQKYRRLHVIVGDANLSEVATFLKVGTTALVLAMIEDDFLLRDLVFGCAGGRRCARCPTTSRCASRSSWPTARRSPRSRCSGSYLDRASKYAEEYGLECVGAAEVGAEVLRAVGGGAHRPRDRPDDAGRPARLGGQVPGRSTATASATTCGWDDARLAAMDLQYHDLRPSEVAGVPRRAASGSPPTTRSTARGHRAAARHPGLVPGQVPAAVGRSTSWRPTGTRWCSTSAATRCAGCR